MTESAGLPGRAAAIDGRADRVFAHQASHLKGELNNLPESETRKCLLQRLFVYGNITSGACHPGPGDCTLSPPRCVLCHHCHAIRLLLFEDMSLERNRFRTLSVMRMIGSDIDAEFACHAIAERGFRKHALN